MAEPDRTYLSMWAEVVVDDDGEPQFRCDEASNRDGEHDMPTMELAANTFPPGTRIEITEPVDDEALVSPAPDQTNAEVSDERLREIGTGSLADLDDLDTEYSRATSLLMQGVHAGISRQDWHATEVAANALRDSALMKSLDKLVDFYRTHVALEGAEKDYHERSTDVHERWETADREEFADLDRASLAIDKLRGHRLRLKADLSHFLPTEPAP